jgi:transcription elongation factor Elf1
MVKKKIETELHCIKCGHLNKVTRTIGFSTEELQDGIGEINHFQCTKCGMIQR